MNNSVVIIIIALLILTILYVSERYVRLFSLLKKLDKKQQKIIADEKLLISRVYFFIAAYFPEMINEIGILETRTSLYQNPRKISFMDLNQLCSLTTNSVNDESEELALTQEISGRIEYIEFLQEDAEATEKQLSKLAKSPLVLPYFLLKRKKLLVLLGFQDYTSRSSI